MSNSSLDAGIPVLTEIIPAPAPGIAPAPKPSVPPAPPIAPQKEDSAALGSPVLAVLDEEQWERLEREVRERVLVQVLERVDFVLEQRVRDSLADVLQTAVEKLADEIKAGLHYSIKDAVTRAVTQEIAKLQIAKKPL
ncbi:hypothetical protein [Noviherbaspirillum sp.]|uniref:hypothetical protein n=1 Tax=Noviherbaspirillum sp. TaxID=1926288 RepID=UPI002B47A15B|nr:hypothetical protein [Noviherbaspirillum sp.]HJV80750.1 hypothetical protein [Noviherbaspirillum sp.]